MIVAVVGYVVASVEHAYDVHGNTNNRGEIEAGKS
jgi:hypothetical protein